MAVKTNSEYHAVQKEIEFAQDEVKTLEDKVSSGCSRPTTSRRRSRTRRSRARGRAEGGRRRPQGDGRRARRAAGVARAHRRRARGARRRARPAACWRSSSWSRASATASPSPRRATASARSATSGCGRRSSTPCCRNEQILQCDSCNRILYFVAGRARRAAADSVPQPAPVTDALDAVRAAPDGSSPTSTAARAAIPGPAGYGVRIEQPDGTLVEEFGESIGVATNNVAEYRGAARRARVGARARPPRRCTCARIRCCSCSRCSATTR